METALITGAGGLVGSETVRFLAARGFRTVGVDNDMRAYYFGPDASTRDTIAELSGTCPHFEYVACDIRDQNAIRELFRRYRPRLIVHTAAQPSHDWAAKDPLTDFTVNAHGTLVLLEAFRLYASEAVFIFTSSNKVYGDNPNRLPFVELESRWEICAGHRYQNGIDETMPIDRCLHSIFGASKLAADVMVQEYGRYFGLNTGVFRAGCITGPWHKGVEQHGFLSYLVRCATRGRRYRIYGYKGKQVRDNIHSYDLVNAFYHFYLDPAPGEVFNIGGGRFANCSVLEAIALVEELLGTPMLIEYCEDARKGDHIWYISDVGKFQGRYPTWRITKSISAIIEELVRAAKDATR